MRLLNSWSSFSDVDVGRRGWLGEGYGEGLLASVIARQGSRAPHVGRCLFG